MKQDKKMTKVTKIALNSLGIVLILSGISLLFTLSNFFWIGFSHLCTIIILVFCPEKREEPFHKVSDGVSYLFRKFLILISIVLIQIFVSIVQIRQELYLGAIISAVIIFFQTVATACVIYDGIKVVIKGK